MALTPLEDAVAHVLGHVPLLPSVEVPLRDALGLVTTVDVTAPEAVPPFANTAVDGFAVRADDVASATTDDPVELPVAGTVAAGDSGDEAVAAGTCVRIMTGAPVPQGADAIVMVEDSEAAGVGRVRLSRAVSSGQHVRPAGDDLPEGAVAVAAGTVLAPAHIGLLATVGRTTADVRRRPRVGVMSTGDELVDDGSELRRGQIRDSNRIMLLAMCDRAGFDGVDLGLVRDDEDAIETALCGAAEACDAVVTSGGVSMGDFDYVKAVLQRIGDMRWMQVAIKPAKPFAFGTIGGTPIFGLPGNPVSSLVSFELFARAGLRAMAGHADPHRMPLRASAGVDFSRRRDGKIHFVRVSLRRTDDDLVATPTGVQGSHQLAASAGADALAILGDGDGVVAGARLEVLPLG